MIHCYYFFCLLINITPILFIELRKFKAFVQNKACPEGFIAESYLTEEVMHLCSRYLKDPDLFDQSVRNFDGVDGESYEGISIFNMCGKFISAKESKTLSFKEYEQARFYVLKNCEEVHDWVDEHLMELSKQSPWNVERRHKVEFISWFEKCVSFFAFENQYTCIK